MSFEKPYWDLVPLADGRSWEVWRAGHRGGSPRRSRYGTIGIDERGYGVEDRRGATYGPFTTLNEAAYALAARAGYHDPLLLGRPNGDAPPAPAVETGVLPRNRRRILIGIVVLLAVVALPVGLLLVGPPAASKRR